MTSANMNTQSDFNVQSDFETQTNSNVQSNSDTLSFKGLDNTLTPLSIYVIVSFICVIVIILYKSIIDKFPTLFTLFVMAMFIVLSYALLIVIGQFSVTLEWACVVVLTFSLLLSTFTVLNPDVFFYPELS